MTKFVLKLNSRLAQLRDEKGATAVEYVLVVGGIAAVIGIAFAAFGSEIKTLIEGIL